MTAPKGRRARPDTSDPDQATEPEGDTDETADTQADDTAAVKAGDAPDEPDVAETDDLFATLKVPDALLTEQGNGDDNTKPVTISTEVLMGFGPVVLYQEEGSRRKVHRSVESIEVARDVAKWLADRLEEAGREVTLIP